MIVENEYCRGPVARMFNTKHGYKWIPSRNIGFKSKTAKGGFVTSGEPDGRVHAPFGIVFYVECKAYFGGVYFSHLHENQIDWYRTNCVESGSDTLHFIAAAVYPARKRPRRMDLDLWRLYLIPTQTWLEIALMAAGEPFKTQAIPLTPDFGRRKWRNDLYAEKFFAQYALDSIRVPVEKVERGKVVKQNELRYRLPETHALFDLMQQAHTNADVFEGWNKTDRIDTNYSKE